MANGVMIRRRELIGMASPIFTPYPFTTNYPALNEYGTFRLTRVSSDGTTSTNTFLKIGSTNYTYAGGGSQTIASYKIVITSESVKISQNNSSTIWINKTFSGFPVRFKRCSGTEGATPLVMFSITKEA